MCFVHAVVFLRTVNVLFFLLLHYLKHLELLKLISVFYPLGEGVMAALINTHGIVLFITSIGTCPTCWRK